MRPWDPGWAPRQLAGAGSALTDQIVESVLIYGSATPALIHGTPPIRLHPDHSDLPKAQGLVNRVIATATDRAARPVVLFSGGVDSSLIALMLRDLGRDDTLLVHYSFDRRDPETVAAVAVARHLGLHVEIVDPSPRLMACLDEPGVTWPAPFADQSTVATFDLCNRLSDLADPADTVVFDGTGADGAFGLVQKVSQMQRAERLPRAISSAGSGLYRAGGWRLRGTLEYRARALRRLAVLEPSGASVAQNSLFGIALRADHLGAIDEELQHWLDSCSADTALQTVLVDLVVTCAAVFAQKSYGPLTRLGFEVCYPFLVDEVVCVGLASVQEQLALPAKDWLKRALRTALPTDLVDRNKTGFIDPRKAMFTETTLQDAIRRAYADGGFARGFSRSRVLDSMLRDLRNPAGLPHGHLNLLWALGFLQRWVESKPQQTAP